MKNPSVYKLVSLKDIFDPTASKAQAEINGKWVPARPIGLFSLQERIRIAFMVFTGKADALVWPEGQ